MHSYLQAFYKQIESSFLLWKEKHYYAYFLSYLLPFTEISILNIWINQMVCHKYQYFLFAKTNWTECGLIHSKTRTSCELSITYYYELVTTSELLGFVVSFYICWYIFRIHNQGTKSMIWAKTVFPFDMMRINLITIFIFES